MRDNSRASSLSTSTTTAAPPSTGPGKRSLGRMAGAVCVLGLRGQGVNVAEGLADALALAARIPWPAVCMGGTAGYHRPELSRWRAGV